MENDLFPPSVRRIVLANTVNERSLPYNLYAIDTIQRCQEFWQEFIAAEPDHEPEKENVVVVCADSRLSPFAWHRVSLGTINSSEAHPREILRPVIACAAYGFVVMHNHPSGDPSPSQADCRITRIVQQASDIMQLRLFDHIIIGTAAPGRSPYYSFREAGMVN